MLDNILLMNLDFLLSRYILSETSKGEEKAYEKQTGKQNGTTNDSLYRRFASNTARSESTPRIEKNKKRGAAVR